MFLCRSINHKEEDGNQRQLPASDLPAAQVSAGDAVLTRLHNHIKADGGNVDEQIDKYTGKQASAENLTWSYAYILH